MHRCSFQGLASKSSGDADFLTCAEEAEEVLCDYLLELEQKIFEDSISLGWTKASLH